MSKNKNKKKKTTSVTLIEDSISDHETESGNISEYDLDSE